MESVGVNTKEQLRVAASQIDQLNRENIRLTQQLKEVMKMNSHWQRYDGQREEHVFELTKSNRELREKVYQLQRAVIEPGKKKDEEPVKKPSKHEVQRVDPISKEEEVEALSAKIVKLKERVAELEIGGENLKKEDDQVTLLREQLNVCVEDFKQERKDRERIHRENLKLRERLTLSEKQVCGRFIDTSSK